MAEGAPEHLLLGRVRQVLVAAHDVGDAHLDVVDDVGQQEHRRAVAAQQHEVLDAGAVERDLAADDVVDDRDARRHAEAQDPAGPGPEPAVARVPVVARLARRLGPLLDLLGREVAVVGVTAPRTAAAPACTWATALALWKYGPSNMRVVGADAEPGEGVDDPLRPLRPVAGLVGVLDAQHEAPAEPLGERPVEQRRPRPADVEEARRRRGDAEAGGLGHDQVRGYRHLASLDRPAVPRRGQPVTDVRARLRSWRSATDSVVRS